MVRPVTFFLVVTNIIAGSQIFTEINIMTPAGGPEFSSASVVWYIVRKAFKYQQMGYATAMADRPRHARLRHHLHPVPPQPAQQLQHRLRKTRRRSHGHDLDEAAHPGAEGQAPHGRRSARAASATSPLFVLLAVGSLAMLAPLLWMFTTSLKTKVQVFALPPVWIPNPPQWDTFIRMWTEAPILSGFKNSLIVALTRDDHRHVHVRARRVRAGEDAAALQERDLPRPAVGPDGAVPDDHDPAVRDVLPAALGGHPAAADRPAAVRQHHHDLLPAAVPVDRAGLDHRGREDRRRVLPADLPRDDPADDPAGDRRPVHPLVHVRSGTTTWRRSST